MNTKYVVVYLDTAACYYEGDMPEIAVHGIYSSLEQAKGVSGEQWLRKHGFRTVKIIAVPA